MEKTFTRMFYCVWQCHIFSHNLHIAHSKGDQHVGIEIVDIKLATGPQDRIIFTMPIHDASLRVDKTKEKVVKCLFCYNIQKDRSSESAKVRLTHVAS